MKANSSVITHATSIEMNALSAVAISMILTEPKKYSNSPSSPVLSVRYSNDARSPDAEAKATPNLFIR